MAPIHVLTKVAASRSVSVVHLSQFISCFVFLTSALYYPPSTSSFPFGNDVLPLPQRDKHFSHYFSITHNLCYSKIITYGAPDETKNDIFWQLWVYFVEMRSATTLRIFKCGLWGFILLTIEWIQSHIRMAHIRISENERFFSCAWVDMDCANLGRMSRGKEEHLTKSNRIGSEINYSVLFGSLMFERYCRT